MMRTYGRAAGVFTLLGDLLKAVVAVLLTEFFMGEVAAHVAGFACMLGHCFPCWYDFKGGKGVATAVGAAIALMPLTAIILLGLFAVILLATKYVAVASGVCAAAYPILAYFLSPLNATENCVFAMLCSLLILMKHTSNFIRLSRGEEGKIK